MRNGCETNRNDPGDRVARPRAIVLDTGMRFIRNWKISVPVAGVVVAGLAWLAFGFFGIHTAFIDEKVDEARPEFDVPADVVSDVETVPDVAESQPDETVEEMMDEPVDETTDTQPPTTESSEPVIVTESSGEFAGANGYDVTGQAVVLGNGTGQRFLRFEDFESSNGPDLNVYLFNPDDSNDFIDLGDLKGNIGEQNYEIATDVDLERYSVVSIWCVRFGTGFGSAALISA